MTSARLPLLRCFPLFSLLSFRTSSSVAAGAGTRRTAWRRFPAAPACGACMEHRPPAGVPLPHVAQRTSPVWCAEHTGGRGAGRCVHALEDTRCMISDPSQLLSLRFSAYCVITRGPAVKEGRALPSMEGRGAAYEMPLGLGVLEAVSLHPPGSPEGSNRESRYSPAFPGLAADFGLRAAPFLHPVCREGPFFSAQRGTRLGLCNILPLFFFILEKRFTGTQWYSTSLF